MSNRAKNYACIKVPHPFLARNSFSLLLIIIHFRVVGVVAQSPDYRLLLIWTEKILGYCILCG